MKKILMLINFFPPSGGGGVYRPLSFVKHLPGLSWKVTVVTPRPGEFWIEDRGLEAQVPPEVAVKRTASFSGQRLLRMLRGGGSGSTRSSGGFGALRQLSEFFMLPDTYAGWIPFATRAASKLCQMEKFDVIYSTSPPDSTHLAAMRVARRFSIPWVADFRDPWIALHLRIPPTALHRAIHSRYERDVSRADRVLVTTDWQRENLLSSYPGCVVEKIPNGFEESDFTAPAPPVPAGGPMTIMHTGMLTLGRSSSGFLKGLSLLLERSPRYRGKVKAVFAGARESDNEKWPSILGLENEVEFIDNVPHAECVAMERSSHALLLIKHDDPLYRGLVPGKLFEYIGARRPVLALAPEGEAASIVRRENRGEVVPPDDAAAIAEALEKICRLRDEGRLEGAYSLESLPAYSRRAAAERLDEVLREMLEER